MIIHLYFPEYEKIRHCPYCIIDTDKDKWCFSNKLYYSPELLYKIKLENIPSIWGLRCTTIDQLVNHPKVRTNEEYPEYFI